MPPCPSTFSGMKRPTRAPSGPRSVPRRGPGPEGGPASRRPVRGASGLLTDDTTVDESGGSGCEGFLSSLAMEPV
jgi:hypothetical protein